MAHAPLTPDQLKAATEKARDDAEQSARNAAASESNAANSAANAASAAAKAENEVEKPKRIAWLNFAVSVVMLLAIGYQGLLTQCSVDFTRDQMRIGFRQQLKADEQQLEDRLNDPQGALSELNALDPNCELNAPVSPSKEASLSLLIQQLLGHYEHYFLMTSALNLNSDWAAICQEAKRLRETYCHIDNRLTPLLQNTTADFKEAFEKCELPNASDQ